MNRPVQFPIEGKKGITYSGRILKDKNWKCLTQKEKGTFTLLHKLDTKAQKV